MHQPYFCPECKIELILSEENLTCKNCESNFACKNKINIFPAISNDLNSKNKILKSLVRQINICGYDAVKKLLKIRPEFNSVFTFVEYDQSADIIFHSIGNKNKRCLEVGSRLGCKTVALSKIFKHVYSVEFNDEYVELQRRKFDEKTITNVSIAKCDISKLPFPDNFFDLVLSNDILADVARFSKDCRISESRIMKELKRVTNHDGKLIFGVGKDSKIGGFRRVKCSRLQKLLRDEGLVVKPYWTFPSYEKPYFSGSIGHPLVLEWLFKNIGGGGEAKLIDHMLSYKQALLRLLKIFNTPFVIKLFEFYFTSFIICCEKNQSDNNMEDWIKKESGLGDFLMMSRHSSIQFILLDKSRNPEKKVRVQRFWHEFPQKIEYIQNGFSATNDTKTRCRMEDWVQGHQMDYLNENEVRLSIMYLMDFQDNTKNSIIGKDEVSAEINAIKKNLKGIPHVDHMLCDKWLKDYGKFMEKNQVFSTSVHGDFKSGNILYDSEKNRINVIDWETSYERGNPLFDIVSFVYDATMKISGGKAEIFKKILHDKDDTNRLVKVVRDVAEPYLGFKLDLVLLARYYFMKALGAERTYAGDIEKDRILQGCSIMYMSEVELLSEE